MSSSCDVLGKRHNCVPQDQLKVYTPLSDATGLIILCPHEIVALTCPIPPVLSCAVFCGHTLVPDLSTVTGVGVLMWLVFLNTGCFSSSSDASVVVIHVTKGSRHMIAAVLATTGCPFAVHTNCSWPLQPCVQ